MTQVQMGTSRRKPSRSLSMSMATDTVPSTARPKEKAPATAARLQPNSSTKATRKTPEGVVDAAHNGEHQLGDADDHPAVEESSRLALSFPHCGLCLPWYLPCHSGSSQDAKTTCNGLRPGQDRAILRGVTGGVKDEGRLRLQSIGGSAGVR
jgi:hypothetical protein